MKRRTSLDPWQAKKITSISALWTIHPGSLRPMSPGEAELQPLVPDLICPRSVTRVYEIQAAVVVLL